MGFLLLIAFIAVPIIEIAVFIEVGGWIGLWPTIGIVINRRDWYRDAAPTGDIDPVPHPGKPGSQQIAGP